ncbi:hypothetical protein SLA2020_010220 [Shorea laevis]
MKGLLLAAMVISFVSLSAGEADGAREWQILTKQNFSSQIRVHPHILLIVTVPWCGESRSLMKEVARMVAERREEFGSLKLMFLYRNTERMVASAIGAAEGISVIYYHHSVSYNYRGKLRPWNILHSVHWYLTISPEEPLKRLDSQEDLKSFLESTDRAFLLGEFCGWSPSMMAKIRNNGTEDDFRMQGFSGERDMLSPSIGKDNQKGMEDGHPKCGIENGIAGIPRLLEFSSVNESASLQEIENMKPGLGLACAFKEFQQFELFFSKFISVARELALPPERHGFGLISNRSLLSSLGVGVSGSWLAVLSFSGCPGCSMILKDGDALMHALQLDNSVVRELDVDGQDLEPALPANKPSVILFVDRSSYSSETRRKGKEALDALGELAVHYQMSDQIGTQSVHQLDKWSVQPYQELKEKHPILRPSPTAQKSKLKDKMSVMIINEGKHVSLDKIGSDLQGSSLHEVLAQILQRSKEAKLSSLAKELGFHLLSDDFHLKMEGASTSETEVESNVGSTSPSMEGPVTSIIDSGNDQTSFTESKSGVEEDKNPKVADVKPSYHDANKIASADASEELVSLQPDKVLVDLKLDMNDNVNVEKESFSEADKSAEQEIKFEAFKVSFFFSDGNYRLLRSLTGRSLVPSLVIVDPISQQHYFFPEDTNFNYFSLSNFLHGYFNGSLVPYQRSESIVQSPRQAVPPPFVNLDFHETDSIPRVTTHTFSKFLFGLNQSDNDNTTHAWKEDVVVLFSSNWCGFCQRMELVVRELYRAIKGYMKMLKSGSGKEQTIFSADNSMNMELPLIYLMDCTLNDCNYILKSINQREVYPALMLFPAGSKKAIPYEGDMAVADIVKFIAHYGSYSRHLFSEKGILWTITNKGERNQYLFEDASGAATKEEGPVTKDKFHEVLLKNQTPKRVGKYTLVDSNSSGSKGSHDTMPHLVVGSILLATDKLLNASPFDKSMIIIVKVDKDTGFQGLIFNKHISWDSLHKLEEGLEFLKETPLSFGGPIMKPGTPLVALKRSASEKQYPEVQTGVYFLDQFATIHEIEELQSSKESITDYWFFLGYAGWDWDQLFEEIDEGAWTISNSDKSLGWPLS